MRRALFWKKEEDYILCSLCPNYCKIKEGFSGSCLVRTNKKDELFTQVGVTQSSINIDPIEKKPLYHFLPGSKTFSLGTVGCNLHCHNCQNDSISQSLEKNENFDLSPEKIIEMAKENNCESISYTYNEPTIFIEQILDIAKFAKKSKLKNILVTNGYINPEPQEELLKYIDGVNVDIKAFNEEFYMKTCASKLAPVLDAAKIYKKKSHLEITRLVIPRLSDDLEDFEKYCKWHKENLADDIVLHISKFHPMYKLSDLSSTPEETMHKFYEIAKKYLKFVYLGNMSSDSNTYCPDCGKILIERNSYQATSKNNKCDCGYELKGMF
jgi:pyruvate formate lyase activating enzyme